MKNIARVFLSVFMGVVAIGSHTYGNDFSLNGAELYKMCSSTTLGDAQACKSYMKGVLDGRITYMWERGHINGGAFPLGICVYDNTGKSIDDVRKAVLEKIKSDPIRYNKYQGGIAIIDTINSSFPCPSNDDRVELK